MLYLKCPFNTASTMEQGSLISNIKVEDIYLQIFSCRSVFINMCQNCFEPDPSLINSPVESKKAKNVKKKTYTRLEHQQTLKSWLWKELNCMIDCVKVQPYIFVFNSAFGALFGVSGSKSFLGPTYVDNQLWFWRYSPNFLF